MSTKVQLIIKDKGSIVLQLNEEAAPESVKNFLNYVQKGHYDGLIFHRIIRGFMIQGGGFDVDMNQVATDAPIKNEANNGLRNKHYTIAMARTSEPHSATAQFFINVADNGFLNHTAPSAIGWGYAVFGEVISGQDLVDKLAAVKTRRQGHHDDVPVEPVVIEKALIIEEAAHSAPSES